MKKCWNTTIIFTNMADLCKFMQKDHIVIDCMIPIKGINDEDIMKVRYHINHKEL